MGNIEYRNWKIGESVVFKLERSREREGIITRIAETYDGELRYEVQWTRFGLFNSVVWIDKFSLYAVKQF